MRRNVLVVLALAPSLFGSVGCEKIVDPGEQFEMQAGAPTPNPQVRMFLEGALDMPIGGQLADRVALTEPILRLRGSESGDPKDWADNTLVAFDLQATKTALTAPGGFDSCVYSKSTATRRAQLRTDLSQFLVQGERLRQFIVQIDTAHLGSSTAANLLNTAWFQDNRGPFHLSIDVEQWLGGSRPTCVATGNANEWACSGGTVILFDRTGKNPNHATIVCPTDPADVWILRVGPV